MLLCLLCVCVCFVQTQLRNCYSPKTIKVQLLSSLNPKQRHRLAFEFKEKTFNAKDLIIEQGGEGNEFYIIQAGQVEVWMNSKTAKGSSAKKCICLLEHGDFFGEKSLLTNALRDSDCIAKSAVVECLVLSRSSFDAALGSLTSILEQDAQQFSTMSKGTVFFLVFFLFDRTMYLE